MANKNLKIKQYRRIVKLYADRNNFSLDKALYDFYNSKTYEMLDKEVGDYHCEGDLYLCIDLEIEKGINKSSHY